MRPSSRSYRTLWTVGLVLAVTGLGCAGGPPPTAATPSEAFAGGEQDLAPGDAVRVRIWREPDLSDEFAVSAEGLVVLPLLGERRVTGVPPGELEERLESEYGRFLENPSIEVTALRRIAVLGEVRSPGLYTVDTTVGLVEAIAQAGGVTPEGDPGHLRVLREGRLIRPAVRGGMIMESVEIQSGDQIVVGRRSWLNRNLPILSIGIGTVSAAIAAAIVAGG